MHQSLIKCHSEGGLANVRVTIHLTGQLCFKPWVPKSSSRGPQSYQSGVFVLPGRQYIYLESHYIEGIIFCLNCGLPGLDCGILALNPHRCITMSPHPVYSSFSTVAMYREPSLHDVAEQSPPRKTPKTSSDSPVLQNGKKDLQSKTKTSTS